MKFSCNRVQLSEAVTNVQRAVSSKAAIPALEGIFITAKGDQLTLVGYDLDIAIETTIDSFITEEGRAILNARRMEGLYLPFSNEPMVCLDTSNAAASSSCRIPRLFRISSNRFFTVLHLSPEWKANFPLLFYTKKEKCQANFP